MDGRMGGSAREVDADAASEKERKWIREWNNMCNIKCYETHEERENITNSHDTMRYRRAAVDVKGHTLRQNRISRVYSYTQEDDTQTANARAHVSYVCLSCPVLTKAVLIYGCRCVVCVRVRMRVHSDWDWRCRRHFGNNLSDSRLSDYSSRLRCVRLQYQLLRVWHHRPPLLPQQIGRWILNALCASMKNGCDTPKYLSVSQRNVSCNFLTNWW